MTLSFTIGRKPRRRSGSRNSAAHSSTQQFESRCLLSASALPGSSATGFDGNFDDLSTSEFSQADTSEWLDEADVFYEPVDSSSIPESFTLAPEFIRFAIDDLALNPAGSGGGMDLADLQIVTLSVNAESGVAIPVDIYLWDGDAESVLKPEFLSQIESALGDALRDVLATGSGNPIAPLNATLFSGSSQSPSTDFASTYGIQPIEVYVDVSLDVTGQSSQLYVSGVTVVSEDPFDSEFLIVDEFFFVADDFVVPTSEFTLDEFLTAEPGLSAPGFVDSGSITADSDAAFDDSDPASSELPDTSTAAGEEPAIADSLQRDASGRGIDSSQTAGTFQTADADPDTDVTLQQQEGERLPESQATRSDARPESTSVSARGREVRHDPSGSARPLQARPTSDASHETASQTMTWRQRLRMRATAAAHQIADAASREPRSLQNWAVSAATDSLAPNWNSTLAAFTQTLLKEQLFGLIDSSSNEELPADENAQPTCAQFASGTGVILIAAAATARAFRQHDRKRRTMADFRSVSSGHRRQSWSID